MGLEIPGTLVASLQMKTDMVTRFAVYLLAAFVLVSSWGFACPDVHMFSGLKQHAGLADKTSDEDCCGDTDQQQSNPDCYRAFNDRVLYPPELSSYDLQVPQALAVESPVLSRVAFSSGLSAGLIPAPPKPTPSLLSEVLRI